MAARCSKCGFERALASGPKASSRVCPRCGGEVLPSSESRATPPPLPDEAPRLEEPESPAPEIPGFRLVRVIGRGGMGVAWEAIQVSLRRRVAVKLLAEKYAQTPHMEHVEGEGGGPPAHLGSLIRRGSLDSAKPRRMAL
jgi:serine/threonine protein kinase